MSNKLTQTNSIISLFSHKFTRWALWTCTMLTYLPIANASFCLIDCPIRRNARILDQCRLANITLGNLPFNCIGKRDCKEKIMKIWNTPEVIKNLHAVCELNIPRAQGHGTEQSPLYRRVEVARCSSDVGVSSSVVGNLIMPTKLELNSSGAKLNYLCDIQ